MQVQVKTDNHIEGGVELTREVEAVVDGTLGRFREWVTRLVVQINDENSGAKAGDNDKRCLMEARPEGLKPVAVSHHGATVDQAVKGCAKKLARLLDDTKGRLNDHKGNTSYAGDQTP